MHISDNTTQNKILKATIKEKIEEQHERKHIKQSGYFDTHLSRV